MRKFSLQSITIFILLTLFAFPAFAQEAGEKINARILPTVWFSALEAEEGDIVRVYSAVQNNSGQSFSGEVVFFADGEEFARESVTSRSDALTEASTLWIAEGGRHAFKAVLEANLPEGAELLSYETAEAELSVKREITIGEVQKGAVEIAETLVEKIDSVALSLAERLETTKRLAEPSPASTSVAVSETSDTEEEGESEVLGASSSEKDAPTSPLYNKGVDVLTLLLEKWMWTLSALAVLVLFWSFKF